MALGRPPVLIDIIEEHFEELDFLWAQRESVVVAPDWNLDELAELEERAEAHLDGLRLAEAHAVDIARPQLTGDAWSAATAATFVLMESSESDLQAEVVEALEAGAPDPLEGIRVGLRHSAIDRIEKDLHRLAGQGESAAVRAAAFDVLAFHRRSVPDGVAALLVDADAQIRRLAWGAAGRVSGILGEGHFDLALADEDPTVQRSALEALARTGLPRLRERCLAAATDLRRAHTTALAFLGVLGHPADFDPLLRALEKSETVEAAVEGLGALGAPASVPVLISAMEDEALAESAARAFVRITAFEDIRGERPAPDLDPQSLDEEFEEQEEGPVDANRARAWWDAHAKAFHPARLWQAGLDTGSGVGGPVWTTWPLLVRRDVYLRACAMRVASKDVELEAKVASGRGQETR